MKEEDCMNHVNIKYAYCTVITAILLWTVGSTLAFNPQSEPPGDQWRIEGFIEMTALATVPTGDAIPFGLDPTIISDGQSDFYAGIIANFTAPDSDGDHKPDDGFYRASTQFFNVSIGDTHWDHTLFTQDFNFQLQGGLVTGVSNWLTDTMPSHPDLHFMFPSSPGEWMALDERNGINLGRVSGTYTLRNAVVPVNDARPYYTVVRGETCSVKFENAIDSDGEDDCLGEDGAVETDIFCVANISDECQVIIKLKAGRFHYKASDKIIDEGIGDSVWMYGFTVTLEDIIYNIDETYTYVFSVTSDDTEGGRDGTSALSNITFDFCQCAEVVWPDEGVYPVERIELE
jgi:hypothetical protein